jgi:ABC-type nitrate/sulfonate/bicarbonate transport system permease component
MWNPYAPLGRASRRGLGVAAVLGVLLLWALLSGLGIVGPGHLPPPWDVARAFVRLSWNAHLGESPLLSATLASSWRVVQAFALVALVGVPIGVLMGASPRINAFL